VSGKKKKFFEEDEGGESFQDAISNWDFGTSRRTKDKKEGDIESAREGRWKLGGGE